MTKKSIRGLDGRARDKDGEIRHKRRDTEVKNLRKTYGEGFAKGMRSDARLGTVLEKAGSSSLSAYIKETSV